MLSVFDKSSELPIVVEAQSEPVRLAVKDLQRDLRYLSGHADGFPICLNASEPAIRVRIHQDIADDGYRITVSENGILVEGSNELETEFAIYAVSEKLLGFLPICRLTDIFPEKRESLELAPIVIKSPERKVKFRGWFLNDEDLLTDFKTPTGPRYIDYPYYENVMNLDVLDMILETALRMEINLIIPSSFVDIANPYEEELVKAVCRRGLYITQHHIEPMGVSYFGADNYMKRHGHPDEAVSFINNRARMEEIWRFYAEKWSHYAKHVIWQLGLRGKGDRSVWTTDKSFPLSPEKRGAIISDAIQTQYRIVSETLGTNDFYSTATLWMEGAQLYGEGHLKLPESTMIIFSDIGFSQMFGDDFYTTVRHPARKYGIYYHTGYCHEGPHLAEACDPRKMGFSYREAERLHSLSYAILNVSNVRPLHLSTWLSEKLLNDPANQEPETELKKLLNIIYGEKIGALVFPIMMQYYDSIGDLGKAELKSACKRAEFFFHDYGNLEYAEFPVSDGVVRSSILEYAGFKTDTIYEPNHFVKILRDSEKRFASFYEELKALEKEIPENRKDYFQSFLLHQTFYMLQMTRGTLAYKSLSMGTAKDPAAATAYGISCMDAILEDRKALEKGEWQGWHQGERKINIIKIKETIRKCGEEKNG